MGDHEGHMEDINKTSIGIANRMAGNEARTRVNLIAVNRYCFH